MNPGLLYPNLPYIIDQTDDGKTVKMSEHLPIMRYLARKHGLYPKIEEERVIAEQTESFLLDVSFILITVSLERGLFQQVSFLNFNLLTVSNRYVTVSSKLHTELKLLSRIPEPSG